jgi:hypothetical protein
VLADELKVGFAARTDLVHVVDLCLDGLDAGFPFDDGLDDLIESRRPVDDLGDLGFDERDLLFGEGSLRTPLLERLEERFGALELIFCGGHLARDISLPRLDASKFGDEFLLCRCAACQFLVQRLRLLHPLGCLSHQRPSQLH